MGFWDRFRPKLDADTVQTIAEFEKAIEAQKAMGLPLPQIAPIVTGRLYGAEELLREVKEGTAIGKAVVRGRMRFHACVRS